MNNQKIFRHSGFRYGELTYGLLLAILISATVLLPIVDSVDIQPDWIPMLATIIIITTIITWLFKQITNREHVILDEVGITMIPILGKSQEHNWEQISHLALTKGDDFFWSDRNSRFYLTDGSYITSKIVSFPPLKTEEYSDSGLLSKVMNNELEIIDCDALEETDFGKALQIFAPQIMRQTCIMSQAKKQKY